MLFLLLTAAAAAATQSAGSTLAGLGAMGRCVDPQGQPNPSFTLASAISWTAKHPH